MAPDGRVVDVAAEETVNRWGGEELHFLAAVVAARKALFAFITDEARFNGDTVTRLKVRDGGMSCENNTSRFVAEDMIIRDDHGPNGTGMPEMDVRPATSHQPLGLSDIEWGMDTRRYRCS